MGHTGHTGTAREHDAQIPSGEAVLEGELNVPVGAQGIVLFAHGSGSSRHSPRNQFMARRIREAGVGTLLFDLLTREEESVDIYTRQLHFDIRLLARRLVDATDWVKREADLWHLRVGYFGASTGAARRSSRRRSSGKKWALSSRAVGDQTSPGRKHSNASSHRRSWSLASTTSR